uniref:Uncharacterized protein n=1 Tax=viral metagenome TaxID=1070528 RepID=A0A6M3LMA7_9ZZZZ
MLNSALEKYFDANREPDQRFVEPAKRRTFEVSQLWEVHHEIVRRLIIGQSSEEISRALNVSKQMVSYTKNSKPVKDKLSLMRAARDADTIDVARDIREGASKALAVLEKIIDDEGESYSMSLVARTAESWMDRAGYVAPKNIHFAGVVSHFTADEIAAIKRRALEDAADIITITEE